MLVQEVTELLDLFADDRLQIHDTLFAKKWI